MSIISNDKIVRTGPKTVFKYDFISDRSEPEINITFLDDNDLKVKFKTSYLSVFEIIYELNKIVLPLVKEDSAQTLSSGKPAGKDKGKGKK